MPIWTWNPPLTATSTATAPLRYWGDQTTAVTSTNTVTFWATATATVPSTQALYYAPNGNLYLFDAWSAQEQLAALQVRSELALGQQQMHAAQLQDFQPAAPAVHGARRRPPELHEAMMRRRAEAARQEADLLTAVSAASAKARELLLSFLDAAQAADFERAKEFFVVGRSGVRYRVRWGKVANIDVYGGRHAGNRLCVHPQDYYQLPVEDVMLAQLLHLRANDDELVRVANVHPGQR